MLEHAHISAINHVIEGLPGDLKRILVIDTDLVLNCLDPHFEEEKVNALLALAGDFIQSHQTQLDGIRIQTRHG